MRDNLIEIILHILMKIHVLLSEEQDDLTQISTSEINLIKAILTFVWSAIFWVIYDKANYKENMFEILCEENSQNIMEIMKYMPEANLATKIDFIDFTMRCMKSIQSNQKLKFQIVVPLNTIYFNIVAPIYLNIQKKQYLVSNFTALWKISSSLFTHLLNIPENCSLLYLLQYLCNYSGQFNNFKVLNEKQNQFFRAILKVTDGLRKNQESSGIIEQRIHVEDFTMNKGNGGIVMRNSDSQLLLTRKSSLSWLLKGIWKKVEEALSDYRKNFGKCHNKLKIMLGLGEISYKMR